MSRFEGRRRLVRLLAAAVAVMVLPTSAVDAAQAAIASEPEPAASGQEHGDVTLVADIEPGPEGSFPTPVAMGGRAYFAATDDEHGRELWTSDGTPEGTALVVDIFPGPQDSLTYGVVAAEDRLFFLVDPDHAVADDWQLWVSDGTAAGTRHLVDLPVGITGVARQPLELTAVGDDLFFTLEVGGVPYLWTSDGTTEGTRQVRAIGTGDSSHLNSRQLTATGGRLYFIAHFPDDGTELWTSDGTTDGTRMVVDLAPGGAPGDGSSSFPRHLTAFGDVLAWQANGDLYVTDGDTAGTRLVLEGSTASADPRPVAVDGTRLYFAAAEMVAPVHNRLWATDGTVTGTRLVADVDVVPGEGAAAGDFLYFSAYDPEHDHERELWRSDGTAEGTRQVYDVNPLTRQGYPLGSDPTDFTAIGDVLFFTADDGANERELWRTDGTAVGTGLVADLAPVDGSPSRFEGPTSLTVLGDSLLFQGDDGVLGPELYRAPADAESLPRLVNLEAPEIRGLAMTGQTLEVTPGQWSESDLDFAYQWYSNGGEIRGVTGSSYTLPSYEIRRRIEVRVIATKSGHASRGASSDLTPPVAGAPAPEPEAGQIENRERPRIMGKARVGSTLVATDGEWSETPARIEHQWFVDGVLVPGATAPEVTVAPAVAGHVVSVRVTASRLSGPVTEVFASPTAPVAKGRMTRLTRPTITGRTRVGRTLRVLAGRARPAASTVTYRWRRDGRPVRNATNNTFRLGKRDAHHRITVRVVQRRPGYRPLVFLASAPRRIR